MTTDFENQLREALHDEEPPKELTVDTAEVIYQGERTVRRRSTRFRQVGAAVAAAAAVAVAVPVGLALRPDSGTDNTTVAGADATAASGRAQSTPEASGGATMPGSTGMPGGGLIAGAMLKLADGRSAHLDTKVLETSPEQLMLTLSPVGKRADDQPLRTTVPAPAGEGKVSAGRFGDMPFYVVAGRPGQDLQGKIFLGPGKPSVKAQQVTAGGFTFIWPDQAALRSAQGTPAGVLWRADPGQDAAVALPTNRTADAPRMLVVERPSGGQALLSTDTRTVQLDTVSGQVSTPVTDPVTIMSAQKAGIGRLAVGLSPIVGIAKDNFTVTGKVFGQDVSSDLKTNRARTGLFAVTMPSIGASAPSGEPLPSSVSVQVSASVSGTTKSTWVSGVDQPQ
ncbi:hypothetical protein [Luteipulveratus mongoliensis]|uniref:Uncharacterized protein n=1 Tax=Luteipulveratus mongoliensis TaxID=571913 RepID=A0A0K1JPC0_9MICO|nr:hypothetical protein [Luteipulveratus mongoliensis]AKU18433.1 hypothetical protein VV02_25575 [Luteipulveratus mongoliensis]